MKFLSFVDVHGSKKAFRELKRSIRKNKPDFLICAGDFTTFEHEVKHIMHDISKLDGKVFLVHGNHEEEMVVRQISKIYRNIEFIHKKMVELKDVVVIGWGGGGFTIRDVEFEDWVSGNIKKLKQYHKEGKKIILVTHAPVYKTRLDLLYGKHHGNKSFYNFIKAYNASYAVSGHFHENAGKRDIVSKCICINPGPFGEIIEI